MSLHRYGLPRRPHRASRGTLFGSLVLAALLVVTTGGTSLGDSPVSTTGATAGCGQTPTLQDGTYTIQSGGKNRTFILDVPDGYDSSHPYRLVLGFHWLGGSAQDVATGRIVETGTWAYYGLQQRADDSTIFVAPQGLNSGWGNAGGEDVVFTDDMLAMIEADLCVDTTLRFSIGFSYGGAMSHSLACSRPDVFRAIVSQSSPGAISGCAGGTEPVAYLGVHGTNDQFGNGEAARDTFVANNGCTPQDTPEPAPGSLTHITTTYQGCAEGYPLVWASFDGDHNPAPRDGASGSGADTWVPDEAWAFLTQFESTL
ncbi:hydrolase [Streptomyces sp. B6B3]|uniref:alpha/beta hydrolase family esterase n=1 Tax=Streptomyces sp. B6B3 TaxID=3153570 RepID=UPI00325EC32C